MESLPGAVAPPPLIANFSACTGRPYPPWGACGPSAAEAATRLERDEEREALELHSLSCLVRCCGWCSNTLPACALRYTSFQRLLTQVESELRRTTHKRPALTVSNQPMNWAQTIQEKLLPTARNSLPGNPGAESPQLPRFIGS
eukprot:scaffold4036_cov236-Pinguiococcus_pyrenoidosus.AAC.6